MEKFQDDIKQAVEVMRKGGVILYPTDTVWGLGCDATNEKAVQRIFEIKQRANEKSMLVLLDVPARLQGYVSEIPDMAWDLIEFATKPLTIIYPKAKNVAQNLVAEDGSLGIRITEEFFSKSLCQAMRGPVVSTSANISGQPTPASFSEIDEAVVLAVDYVVKYRQKETVKKTSSSIIKLGIGNQVQVIRE